MEPIEEYLNSDNFMKVGMSVVVIDYLPVIKELIIQGKEHIKELEKQLETEQIKNAELHKVIKAIGDRKGADE